MTAELEWGREMPQERTWLVCQYCITWVPLNIAASWGHRSPVGSAMFIVAGSGFLQCECVAINKAGTHHRRSAGELTTTLLRSPPSINSVD